MNARRFQLVVVAAVLLACPVVMPRESAIAQVQRDPQTPSNLRRALDVARKGVTMFDAFAKKADEEGYKGTASLFRAAARSQRVHVSNFEKATEGLKPEAFENPVIPEVKSTRENLAAAIDWANAQRTQTLPGAIAAARNEGEKSAENALNYMRQSFTEIARFARSGQNELEASRQKAKEFFVDRTCGYVVDKLDFQKCPVCFSTRDNFERVE